MLTIEDISDEDLMEVRNTIYRLAEIAFDTYIKKILSLTQPKRF